MALAHQSIATINSPQFINLQPLDINPLMSSCQIKVLYIGENRNRSYISKDVAAEMAKTLRGAPIVGYYKKDKQDFADHGEQLIWDDEGIHFNCLTKPYGFVSPDAKVWFQDFEDQDDFGNSITRTYLMTTGYLWSGQFEEAQQVLDEGGKPHSMELDEKSLEGHWSTNIKQNMEFFIINDAIFSKLCILGDDVEPCFEGSAVTAPQVSASFTLDDNFKHTLFEMMQELTYALKGGNTVADIKDKAPEVQTEEIEVNPTSEFSAENQDNSNESLSTENEINTESTESTFEKKDDDDKEENNSSDEGATSESDSDDKDDNDDDDDDKKKYTALEEKFNTLQSDYTALEAQVKELRAFKENIESKQKDDLIGQFYMLSDEDKKDVIENKAKYSLEEIESKLAVICFKKKVNFNLDNSSENEDKKKETEIPVTTFNVDNREDSTPDWIKAVESTMNSKF